MELFASNQDRSNPLADRMRPRTIEEYVGQDHIVGPGRLLRRVIQADQLSSLIFYGPPGTGKTTLARVIAGSTRSHFITMNAVLSGVKQLRESIEEAKQKREFYSQRTILFIDEVHRWNKAQQDALLPWVENGTVVLIGATTENPYFEVNSALVSRSRIFQLKSLNEDDLFAIARMTLSDKERGYGRYRVHFEKGALEHLVRVSNGDARTLLNALELAVETTPESFPPEENSVIRVSVGAAEESIQRKAILYDKEGDYHFDTISAFIKSVRGSDPDAALYWLARMIRAGEDPRFIFRRMLISAAEDVGLADPQALVVTEAAAAAFDRVGLPEGQFHLTQAALYLSTAPKSNSSLGFFDALTAIDEDPAAEVPNHLRDGNRDAAGFGHGKGYLYPHAYRDHWVAQHYLPEALGGRVFYAPSDQGYEGHIRPRIHQRREEQISAALDESPEILSYSPGDKARERWALRAESGAAEVQRKLRDLLFTAVPWQRHFRVLDILPASGLFMTEALRRCPEGEVVVCESDSERINLLNHMASGLQKWEQPRILDRSFPEALGLLPPAERKFELVMGQNLMISGQERHRLFQDIRTALKPEGRLIFADPVPREGMRLSLLLEEAGLETALLQHVRKAENQIYQDPDRMLVNWDTETVRDLLTQSGFHPDLLETVNQSFEIRLGETRIESWFSTEGGFGSLLARRLEPEESLQLEKFAVSRLTGKLVSWKRSYLVAAGSVLN